MYSEGGNLMARGQKYRETVWRINVVGLSADGARSRVEAVASKLGSPAVLVNAAGGNDPRVTVTPENSFEKISVESWSSCFELNVTASVLFPCQEFGPAMCAGGAAS
jgi:NAD(P)-dependent dehydrogenase (short-subunit alcohol dehydrogenase family)